jgi:molybdopterin converting factor small subunit
MKVSVICFGAMRAFLPGGEHRSSAELEVPSDATVQDVVDSLGAPRRLVFAVLVDGRRAGIEAPLRDGSQVTLMPPFAGGCRST